jgi:predicted AAA+ superfamily ATPase
MSWRLFYESYLATYIEKDIRVFGRIEDEHNFIQFMRALAARTGQLLNYSDLARDAGVSVNTAKSWASLLETAGLVFLLYPWSRNLTSRVVKTPKVYFFDTGLAAYLAGQDSPEILSRGPLAGPALETYVIGEIIKSYWNNGERPSFFFYRDVKQREIDLIIEKGGLLYPIEIKKTASPRPTDVANFALLDVPRICTGTSALICQTAEPVPLGKNAVALPVGEL